MVLGDPGLEDRAKKRGRFGEEDLEAFERMKRALAELAGRRLRYLEDHATLLADLASAPPAFVLNFCDTGYRNRAHLELHLPAYLDLLGVPYSGAPPACLALCYDKAAVRAIAAGLGVPVPEETFLRPGEPLEAGVPQDFPALVKPNRGDGSVGITQQAVASTAEEARACIERLRAADPDAEILVQEYLEGAELGIGLIGNPSAAAGESSADGFTVLPPLEVDYSRLPAHLPPILSYESKADPDSPYYTEIGYRRATLPAEALDRLTRWSKLLFTRLGCRDYARFDYRAGSDGRIHLLEVNPNPAWCWDGKMAIMASFENRSYPDLLRLILEAAEARHTSRRGIRSSQRRSKTSLSRS